MPYMRGEFIKELWAVVNEQNHIAMSRGGSSSNSKIMVYMSRNDAMEAINNRWTRQAHDIDKLQIKRIY